jgi:type I restriction enzyme M protein
MPRGRPKKSKNGPTGKATDCSGTGAGANLGFETYLFEAADKLRKNLEPSGCKHVVLGLMFLKHISNAFEAERRPAYLI